LETSVFRILASVLTSLSLLTSLTEARKMEPRVHRAIRLMTADLRRQTSLDEAARSVNLSASRLRHLFKHEIGVSPARFLKAQRMQKAEKLLETTFLSVKEVMLKVGFKHRGHFVRGFKKVYGLSPSQYRLQYLEAQQMEVKESNN
jgi:AraC family transcriptional regulator of arabinose operon